MRSVSLVFPPLTEATLFPYLSLPALAGVLNAEGIAVTQTDANLEVIERLLRPTSLTELRRFHEGKTALRHCVRRSVIDAALSNPRLWWEATKKPGRTDDAQARSIRLTKRILDIAIESSRFGTIGMAIPNAMPSLQEANTRGDLLLGAIKEWTSKHVAGLPRGTVLGLTVPFFSQILPSLWICHHVRMERPDLLIVLGGPQIWLHFSEIEREARENKLVDALCYAEGELAITAIAKVQDVSELSSLPNTYHVECATPSRPRFEDQVPTNINALPPPLFDKTLASSYLNGETQYPLTTCVGCYWGRCSFCSYGNRYHAASLYRELTPEQIAACCLHLIENYEATRINFVDENCNLKLIARAMRIVRARGRNVRFSVRNRLDNALASDGFCKELAGLGCELMSVGYETNSQRLLDLMDRGLRASNFETILKNVHQAGINVRVSVMGAIPGETDEELQQSMQFLSKIGKYIGIDSAQAFIAEPMTYISLAPTRYGATRVFDNLTDCNKQLGFGLGRAGHKLDSSGTVTESMFSESIRRVAVAGNDEIPPTFSAVSEATATAAVRLLPHCFFHKYEEATFIVGDLSWQSFRKISTSAIDWDGDRDLSANSRTGHHILSQLVNAGLAEPRLTLQ
jgi:anaerobic magnesium-protoporphyrin IX monomethyl ester cyclase